MVAMAGVMGRFAPSYLKTHTVSGGQQQLIRDIQQCRTSALGGHWTACTSCGDIKVHYNSCGNRFCPNCQGVKKEKWILERTHDLLPVKYFHVVFTLPCELRGVCFQNQKLLYNLLFKSAWQTIEAFSKDPKQGVSARMGMISVLHTWTQKLLYHPHIHCIVPAGGIGADGSWKSCKSDGDFLFHVQALAETFRGKFMEQVVRYYKSGGLILEGKLKGLEDKGAFWEFKRRLYDKIWVVNTREPFEKPDSVLEYLGRYTHRIAISNYRILAMDDKTVTFSYLDRNAGQTKPLTLTGEQFIGRFLLHVLPKGYCKIRHYGILSTRVKTVLLAVVRKQFGLPLTERPKYTVRDVMVLTLGIDPHLCSICKEGQLIIIAESPRSRGSPKLPQAC